MIRNYFKIAWRNAFRSKLFTALNILGLSLGFAGFILAYLYINRETSYDRWNPHYDDIYLIGLTHQGNNTDLTPPALAAAIREKIPEIEAVGNIAYFLWEVPFISDDGQTYVKDWKVADPSIAQMFGIETFGTSLTDGTYPQINLLAPDIFQQVFPATDQHSFEPQKVMLDPWGMTVYDIHGTTKPRGPSNITYEAIFITPERNGALGQDNKTLAQTYVQLTPGADIAQVNQKINHIFRQEVSALHVNATIAFANGDTYLDPLKNLHLRPRHGSNTGYLTVWSLGILAGVILLLAGINFANLMVAQANRRAKEIGLKKVFGVSRGQLAVQFLGEVLLQCLLAAVLAWGLVVGCQHLLQQWLAYDLAILSIFWQVAWPLLLAALITALVSGAYPAIILSGYHPIHILKGDFQTSYRTAWFRYTLLTFQFVMAVVFITGMLILHRQLDFMRQGDKGFEPAQVVYIKNLAMLNKPSDFKHYRDRMTNYAGIESMTVASSVPGGTLPPAFSFQYRDVVRESDQIGVDFDYFETMGIDVLQGRSFTTAFAADSINGVVINEAAAQAFGMQNPVGETIRGCDTDFEVVGVVKDSKVEGFQQLVRPTIYSINSACRQYKSEILIRLKPGTTRQTLAALAADWDSIAKDWEGAIVPSHGNNFRYEFLDQKYAALHAQQEQLASAFSAFTLLSVVIAVMGLFSMSAYSIGLRQKEISIRKVLGASLTQIFVLLNSTFFRICLLANLIGLPVAYVLMDKWLATFAYRIDIHWWMFAIAGAVALLIALLTVSWQAIRAAHVNPVDSLRDE